jgi:cell shape-determining protein MreC
MILQLPAGTKVEVGDRIVTSPSSTFAPPDIPVGAVTKVTEQPGGIGVTAFIKPYVDIGGLQYVTVLEWVKGKPPVYPSTTTSTTTTTTTAPGGLTTTTPTTNAARP